MRRVLSARQDRKAPLAQSDRKATQAPLAQQAKLVPKDRLG